MSRRFRSAAEIIFRLFECPEVLSARRLGIRRIQLRRRRQTNIRSSKSEGDKLLFFGV
jgi:hypothetical protein